MKKTLGIDVGTSNTRICLEGSGVILREPTVAAVSAAGLASGADDGLFAAGATAKLLSDKLPGSVDIIYPVVNGVIKDFDTAADMLCDYFDICTGEGAHSRPNVTAAVSPCLKREDKDLLFEALFEAGARSVNFVSSPVASAVGAGITTDGNGTMIIDIGGGSVGFFVISGNEVIHASELDAGGVRLSFDIMNYIMKTRGLAVTFDAAEELKGRIGSAVLQSDRGSADIFGLSGSTGLPGKAHLTSLEVRTAALGVLENISVHLAETLSGLPDNVRRSVAEQGIYLVGNGSRLSGIDLLVSGASRCAVHVVENAGDMAALGACLIDIR